eukprot:TRINITY_DN32949_c0_g1_i1.p1 TRINITY_DN32949_c0_g1~~TRINITY_DN32949_c0_g1_i1.p1  ORF type:complete len:406 (-),score=72.75 TRINITY_DN32949_c0_g1_i1:62-1279(-)
MQQAFRSRHGSMLAASPGHRAGEAGSRESHCAQLPVIMEEASFILRSASQTSSETAEKLDLATPVAWPSAASANSSELVADVKELKQKVLQLEKKLEELAAGQLLATASRAGQAPSDSLSLEGLTYPVASKMYTCRRPHNMEVRNSSNWADWVMAVITSTRRFGFIRFGDGEWSCVLLQRTANIDNLQSHGDMCNELRKLVLHGPERDPDLYMLMSHHICRGVIPSLERLPGPLGTFYMWFGLLHFLDEGAQGENAVNEIVSAMKARGPTVLVGPTFLGRLHDAFSYSVHIKVPNMRFCKTGSDAWLARVRIESEMVEASTHLAVRQGRPGVVFFVAAGMATNVIVPRMMSRLPMDSFFDIGSFFDGWAGYSSRDYHSQPAYFEMGKRLGWVNASARVSKQGCKS